MHLLGNFAARQSGPSPVVHRRRAHLRTRSVPHVMTLRQHPPDLRPEAESVPGKRCIASTSGTRCGEAPPSTARERRCKQGRTCCTASSTFSRRPSTSPVPTVRGRRTRPRQQAPSRGHCLVPRGGQAATGRSFSPPIIQIFGWSKTRVTNAFSVRTRLENSAAV